jgi:hypothetical protein
MEGEKSSEMLVSHNITIWHHKPDGHDLNRHHREDLKPRNMLRNVTEGPQISGPSCEHGNGHSGSTNSGKFLD